MERMFDEVNNYWPEESRFFSAAPASGFAPACDVEDTETHTLLSFDLPGMKKEDIRIEMFENELRVSGERQEEHEEKSRSRTQVERYRGNFYR
jgi:HSP20 family protein